MLTRSMSLKSILLATGLCGLMLFVLNFFSFYPRSFEDQFNGNLESLLKKDEPQKDRISSQSDVQSNSRPATLTDNDKHKEIPKVPVHTYLISVNHRQEHQILVRETTGGTSFAVLFLHGQKFSSQNWQNIGTLQYLASWGYRAVAIDLPGYGNSSLPVIDEKNGGIWLKKLIEKLRLNDFVLVSPSMSGRFSIPYIVESVENQKNLRGFVPIAPVSADLLDEIDTKKFDFSTLIIQGELDTSAKSTLNYLKRLPNAKVLTIPKASHACYIDKPLDFHNGLRQFLYDVFHPISVGKGKVHSHSQSLTAHSNKKP